MFNKLFKIGQTIEMPVLEKEPVVIKAPKVKKSKPAPSVKNDALKVIESLLNDLQYVNNPKVDSLRKLYHSLENGSNMCDVVSYFKEPIPAKKKEKKKVKSAY